VKAFLARPVEGKLDRRGLHGVKLVVSDAHEGIKAASKMLDATRQRCRVNFMRNAPAPSRL
jgi:putative transposase